MVFLIFLSARSNTDPNFENLKCDEEADLRKWCNEEILTNGLVLIDLFIFYSCKQINVIHSSALRTKGGVLFANLEAILPTGFTFTKLRNCSRIVNYVKKHGRNSNVKSCWWLTCYVLIELSDIG